MSDDETNYLKKYGIAVAKNGWPIVLLAHGSKKPLLNKWASRPDHKVGELVKLANQKRYGVGIRCGNIVGLDNDYEIGGVITDDFLNAVEAIQKHFFPKVLQRRGRSTRRPLQVFRLKDDQKLKSTDIGKLQILAAGRQFVAYNIHPDTDEPYRWLRPAGWGDKHPCTPATMKYADCPQYDVKRVYDFIKSLHLLEETWGLNEKSGADELIERIKAGDYKPGELRGDESLITHACKYIENLEEWGWDDWNNRIMMPLWGASGGEPWGLELAHKVSEPHSLYDKDTTDQRWEQLTASPPSRIGAGTLLWMARQNGMPFLGPRDWDQYKVFVDRDSALNTDTGDWVSRQMFNDLFNSQKTKGQTPIQAFMLGRPEQVYSTIVWDPALTAGDVMQGKRKVWNTCIMPTDYGKPGDIGPWLELMQNIYGDAHVDMITKRMAFDVQYPHLKSQWHELIIGEHGVGKNLTKAPLRLWFEQTGVAKTINAERVESSFNSYVKDIKHLEIEEVAGMNNRIFNKLKSLLASMDPWYEVNEKFLRPYRMRNVISAWLSSNEVDAVSLAPTERRLYVVHKHSNALPEDTLVDIFNWIRKNWQHVIYHLKHEVEVSDNFGNILPARTKDMLDLVNVAGRAHDKLRSVIRDATRGVVVFNLTELHFHMVEAGVCERPGTLVSLETVRKSLISEGALKCNDGEPIKLNGAPMRLYTFDREIAAGGPKAARTGWQLSDRFKRIIGE